MKVLHIVSGLKYDVWAMCDDDGTCQMLEELQRTAVEHSDLVETIAALLYEVVPNDGPPLDDVFRAKMLYRDILFELKADKDVSRRKHVGLRVVFFFDNSYEGGPVVVCTHAFCKSGGTTPQEHIDLALTERSRYFEEKDQLEVL